MGTFIYFAKAESSSPIFETAVATQQVLVPSSSRKWETIGLNLERAAADNANGAILYRHWSDPILTTATASRCMKAAQGWWYFYRLSSHARPLEFSSAQQDSSPFPAKR